MSFLGSKLSNSRRPISGGTILRIICFYGFFGALWVGSSDLLVYFHGGETWQDARMSLLKGLLFVAGSAILLYGIITKCVRDTVVEREAFRELLRNWNLAANDIVFLLEADGRIHEANDRAVAAYGYTAAELIGKNIKDLLDSEVGLKERWHSLLQSGTLRAEAVHRRADGSRFPVECSARRFEIDGLLFFHITIRDVSARNDAERQLLNLKNAYAALLETNHCINECATAEQLFRHTCEIAVRYTGLKVAWIGVVERSLEIVVPIARAGSAAEYVQGLQVSVNPDSPWSKGAAGRAIIEGRPVIGNQLWKSDGYQPWTERLIAHSIHSWAAYPLIQDGEAVGVLALYSDDPQFFTHEIAALLGEMADDLSHSLQRIALASKQLELEAELQRLKMAVEQSPVTVLISDASGAIQYVNPAFTVASGYTAEEVHGQNPSILKSGETPPQEYEAMWRRLTEGEPWTGHFHNKRKDGVLYWEEAVISPVKDSRGIITHYIAVKQDVTGRREMEAKARFLAFHDPLTELPNRLVAKSKMDQAIKETNSTGGKAALFFIDVDNFKRVNDSLGHTVGDHLLKSLVQRLTSCLREEDTLSRVSGDEFLVVSPGIHKTDVVQSIAERMRRSISSPLEVDGMEISTTISIGASVYPDNALTFDELHRQADLAMYSAKREGRDTFRIYTRSMETNAHEYVLTVNGLRRALERGEFVLHYQPQVHLETGEVRAVEALIRWSHPELGLVPPAKFIPIAEDSGLIVEMGNWVIRESCRQASEWSKNGLRNLRIAMNVSALQLRRGTLGEVVSAALGESDLEPALIEIELTESALIYDNAGVASLLKLLRGFGISIALDDFGTGYSNLTYLKHFDLDRLKIDQSFIRNITSNRGDVAIVKSIVQLARNFGLETVAEGVENEEALKVVRRAGCNHVQGFLLSRPMQASEVPAFVANRAVLSEGSNSAALKYRYSPPSLIQ